MKLLTRATRAFILAGLLATVLGGLFCYGFLAHIRDEEASEELHNIKAHLQVYVRGRGRLPAEPWTPTQEHLLIRQVNQPIVEQVSDTLIFNDLEKERITYRQLTFGLQVRDKQYQITIQKPLLELEDLTEALLMGFAGLLLALLITLILVNYRISSRLWKPFYQTFNTVSSFQSGQENSLSFMPTKITEFDQLQTHLLQLTEQIRRDFRSLKAFTENASHELQTPLAIVRVKLEALLQDENLTPHQSGQLNASLEAIGRMSKLNQTLLLLTKIENRQFVAVEPLCFSELIAHKLEFMSEWIQHKQLHLHLQTDSSVRIAMNPYLADVLLNNLLSNAIKHNHTGGQVTIRLTRSGLTVANTGDAPNQPTELLRQRFRKNDSATDSPGLGLAIIDEIGHTYGIQVHYHFAVGWHYLTLDWPQTEKS